MATWSSTPFNIPQGSMVQIEEANRRRRFADALRQQQQPQGQMVGGIYVAPSITQNLATLLQNYQGGQLNRQADKQVNDVLTGIQNRQTAAGKDLADALSPKEVQIGKNFSFPEPAEDGTTQAPTMTPINEMQGPTPQDIQSAQLRYALALQDPQMIAQALQGQAALAQDESRWNRSVEREDQVYNRGRADKIADVLDQRAYDDIIRKEQQGFQLSLQERNFKQQMEMQDKNQAFQSGENQKNRSFQAGENAKNRTNKSDIASIRAQKPAMTAKQAENAQGKLNTVAILRKQIENLEAAENGLGGLSGGPVLGSNPLSETGSNYDGALAALQTTVRQLTRTPGEGAMSDYESRLAQAQLPQRSDFKSTRAQKIQQLKDLADSIEQGYSGMVGTPGQGGASGGWGIREIK